MMQVNIWDILQVVTPAAIAVVGWGVRLIWSEIRSQRAELREYVRQETCKAHREHFRQQLDAVLRRDHAARAGTV